MQYLKMKYDIFQQKNEKSDGKLTLFVGQNILRFLKIFLFLSSKCRNYLTV